VILSLVTRVVKLCIVMFIPVQNPIETSIVRALFSMFVFIVIFYSKLQFINFSYSHNETEVRTDLFFRRIVM